MSMLNAFLVEDSPVIRDNLIGALEEMAPIEVIGSADDEPSAVAWLTSNRDRCDLVIIDIFLKSGSGLGVLEAVHALHRPMTLVVLSNYATPAIRTRCAELGAARVFDKSNQLEELIRYCTQLAH